MMPYLYFKPFAVKPRVLAVSPVRVAGRCEGGDVTALSCSHIDRHKLPKSTGNPRPLNARHKPAKGPLYRRGGIVSQPRALPATQAFTVA